jgi:hypothetical protein
VAECGAQPRQLIGDVTRRGDRLLGNAPPRSSRSN